MNGLMMDLPLTITSIMDHAVRVNGDVEIVSVTHDNPRHRYTYRDAFGRAAQLANAIAGWGLSQGDRIATLAWNDYRHFETYYASACSGYVCHTINPRLFPEQLVYIINHAEDEVLFVDATLAPLIAPIQHELPTVRHWVVMDGDPAAAGIDDAVARWRASSCRPWPRNTARSRAIPAAFRS